MVVPSATIDSLLKEKERYPPPTSFRGGAWVRDDQLARDAAKDPERFWSERAKEFDWSRPWSTLLEWKPPFARWFVGGTINVSQNCVDRHAASARRNKAAIVWEGEPGEKRVLTYAMLMREVNRFANVLKGLDVKRGDRVTIYMPMIPELPIAMLACARIGAIHSVIFGGFSAKAIHDRVEDAESEVIVTADGGYRRGNIVPLKRTVDEAVADLPVVRHVVVYARTKEAVPMRAGRDVWWHDAMAEADPRCDPEPMDATDPLFVLYTSGTTGKPKGVLHSTGGYLVGVATTHRLIFDIKEDDLYWCTADIGWVTGHSYIVYGPLANGATTFMYEGAPDWPHPDRWWSLIQVGRRVAEEARPLESPPPRDRRRADQPGGVALVSPDDRRRPLSDRRHVVADRNGHDPHHAPPRRHDDEARLGDAPVPRGRGGGRRREGPAGRREQGRVPRHLEAVAGHAHDALQGPGAIPRYRQVYWSQIPGKYFTGDGARIDEDGCFWLMGRIDDVINVAGHRIGTMEVESALVSHPKVAEAAVVGRPHPLKGQALVAYVVLKSGHKRSDALRAELQRHVRSAIGAIAVPDDIYLTEKLPKTRSGKIMRRVIRSLVSGQEIGDTTTLEDPGAVEEVRKWLEAVEGKGP